MSLILHFNRQGEWGEILPSEALLRRAVAHTLTQADVRPAGELSVTFVTEAEIRDLHREYLGVDAPTDVIAFDLSEDERILGDVYVCPEVARGSADRLAVPVPEEVLRLVVHGILHLLGHNHPAGEGRDSSPMYALQERILLEMLSEDGDPRHEAGA